MPIISSSSSSKPSCLAAFKTQSITILIISSPFFIIGALIPLAVVPTVLNIKIPPIKIYIAL